MGKQRSIEAPRRLLRGQLPPGGGNVDVMEAAETPLSWPIDGARVRNSYHMTGHVFHLP